RRHTRFSRDWSSDVCSSDLHMDQVDWQRGLIRVHYVQTRRGLRPYPKSKKSYRTVPVPDRVLDAMRHLADKRPRWGECTCPKVEIGRASCRERRQMWAGGGA